MEYRRFTQTDWYGYAGAEKFKDGSEPFIWECYDVKGCDIYAIADKNGLCVDIYSHIEGEDEPTTFAKMWEKPEWSSLVAESELKMLVKTISTYTEATDLVYSLLHPENEVFKGFERYL